MADFCRQCSIETFGSDTRDLAGLVTKEESDAGIVAVVLCEGCGPCLVDEDGTCVDKNCLNKHGKEENNERI